jgi:hypothetical protein
VSRSEVHYQMGLGKRVALLLGAFVAAAAMFFSTGAPDASAKTEYGFCEVWLAPYGQYGDRCNAWGGGQLNHTRVYGFTHSACIDYTNGIDANLMYSWACTGSPPGGSPAVREVSFWNDGIYRKPIIRNNTTGDNNRVAGYYSCYTDC